jgi:hypothetical protein
VEEFIAEQFGFSARSGPLLAWRLKIFRQGGGDVDSFTSLFARVRK